MRLYAWLGVVASIIGIIVFTVLSSGQSEELVDIQDKYDKMVETKEKEQKRFNSMTVDFDKKEYQNEIDTKTVNAKKAGKKIIDIQNELADLFRVDGNPSKKFIENRLKRGPELAEKQAEFTDIDPMLYHSTWKLNKDWDLKLETVISYQNVATFPVVFSMTTTEGKPAGMIKATYNVNDDSFTEIERHYTVLGERESVQGVGD